MFQPTNRATRAVRRLAADPGLRSAFRRDPHLALARWRLTRDQVEAIKAGDARSLARADVDVTKVEVPPVSLRLRARALAVLAATLGLLGGPVAGTALAGRTRARRFGRRYIRADALDLRSTVGDSGPRAARRFADGVQLRVQLVLVPDGCDNPKACGYFEVIE